MSETQKGFISEINSGVPEIEKASIISVTEQLLQNKSFINKEAVLSKINELKSSLKDGLSFKAIDPDHKIRSEYFNEAFEKIYLDLLIIYNHLALIASDKSKIKSIIDGNFINTKASINSLINQLRLFRFLKQNPEYDDAKFISFINSVNTTKAKPSAVIDSSSKILKLPTSDTQRFSASRFNLENVKVTANHYGGGVSSIDDVNFGPDKTLDSNPDTFYANMILCDGNPNHYYRLSHSYTNRPLSSGSQNGKDYISNGIIFELLYDFSKTINCNQIKLLPIADYPVKILDIAYKTSDSSFDWITVPGFNPYDYADGLDWIEWNGKRFSATQIKIVFEQANYSTNIYHLPSDLVKNNTLWSQIIDKGYQEIIHNIELDNVVSDKIAVEPGQLAYLNELNDLNNSIKNTLIEQTTGIKQYDTFNTFKELIKENMMSVEPSANNFIETKKLQYIFGLRSIEINDNTYQPYAFYESPKLESNANILEIEIDTNETHESLIDPVGGTFNLSSIQWEVEAGSNIFLPIVPISNKIVNNDGTVVVGIYDEVLSINKKTNTATTRFPVSSTTKGILIRKNGIRLNSIVSNSGLGGQAIQNNYTISLTSDNKILISFNDKYFDQKSLYTISYYATETACTLDLNALIDSSKPLEPEVFGSTDKDNRIRLKYYPYIEYTIINDENSWVATQDYWSYIPGSNNYSIGTVSILTSNLYLVTGSNTSWLTTGNIDNMTNPGFKFIGDDTIYPISGVTTETLLVLSGQIETGFLLNNLTGLPYVIGETVTLDDIVYGIDNLKYEPITVYVNNIKANNKTNYSTMEHLAFTNSNDNGVYEYIQQGKDIFFNQPINGKIEVYYRYLTEYIKINAILQSHRYNRSVVTPIVKDYMVRLKTSKI